MIRFEKRTITCDVGIAKCENGTTKHEKTVKEPPNLEKQMVTYDVGTAQCKDITVKCGKKKPSM